MSRNEDNLLNAISITYRVNSPWDEQTKDLIERAAHLESRKLTDFCVAALTDAARRTIAEHETLILSDLDRKVFFDTLMSPPQANERLVRAMAEHKRRIIS